MSRRTTAFRPETASVSARISQPLLPQACNHCWHTNASARRHLHRTMTDDTVRVGMVHAKTREDPRLRSCVLLLHYSLHSVLFALCTLCTLYSLHSVLFALCTLCTVYSLHCVLFALCTICTVYSLHCCVLFALCTLCTVYYSHCVLFALCALCTVYSLHCVLFALCTICTTLCTTLCISHNDRFGEKAQAQPTKATTGGVTFGRAFSCNDSRSLAKANDPPVSSRA